MVFNFPWSLFQMCYAEAENGAVSCATHVTGIYARLHHLNAMIT